MATATVARPVQALRQRDRAPRPSLGKRSITVMDESASKKRKLNEPYVRTSDYILRKHRGKPPSLVIHLHPTHFRFGGQDGSFAYDSPMKFVLEHLRRQTVPHEMLEELLSNNVIFYDGCLIVEVHNYRTAGSKEKGRQDASSDNKFSMHNYNEHVTPSPMAPYPPKADKSDQSHGDAGDMPAPDRENMTKPNDGPKVVTIVLHPTELTRHHELLILANTPAWEVLRKRKSGEAGTPSSAQPPTPSIPSSPLSTRGPLSQPQKMCLEENDFYAFQADMLVATEEPLYLEPVKNSQDAERVLELLGNPLHDEKPPSPKTRKRTTAQMAADDAQAAEAERRMLIMDERIKPSARAGTGAASNDNQGAAASLGFSRFKTLEMVRQKHEEQERIRKDEDTRAALEKKQQEDANTLRSQQILAEQNQRKILLAAHHAQRQHQANAQLRQEHLRAHHLAAAQRAATRDHGHPPNHVIMQQMPQNAQQSFQQPAHGSPIARQQTPFGNSSPMLNNGGFPMTQASSQGAGSPLQSTAAALQHRNAAMARQASQQQHGSQNTTPQIARGTPSMAQAIPNRQMSSTPRMPPGSPSVGMQGTPSSATMQIMPTPHMGQNGQFTPEQVVPLQAQQARQHQQGNGMHAGSPGAVQNLTAEQIHNIRMMNQQRALMAQANMNPSNAHAALQQQQQNIRLQMMRHQAQQVSLMRQQQQMNGQAGSPMQGMHPQATPQMGHAHPGTPLQQPHAGFQQEGGEMPQQQHVEAALYARQQQIQQAAQNQLQGYIRQYGSLNNIPQNIIPQLPAAVQRLLQIQKARQQPALHQQAFKANQLATQHQSTEQQVPGQPNPAYMQQLKASRDQMRQQMQKMGQQQQPHLGNGIAMNMHMGNMPNNGNDLSQHFANAMNAMRMQQGGGNVGGMQ